MNKATLNAILPNAGKGRRGKLFLSRNCYSPENALHLYQYLKLSLLDINNWSRRKSGISINAKLVDLHGRQVGRIARITDRIKIILPRWQSFLKIYDWFEIRRIEERLNGNMEIFFVTIMPSVDPLDDLSVPPESSKRMSNVTIFVIRDEHKVELQIHTRERRLNFQGATLKVRLGNIAESLLVHNRFYKSQWGKLLRSLMDEGSSNFTNLN
jgi:hypothetical protein